MEQAVAAPQPTMAMDSKMMPTTNVDRRARAYAQALRRRMEQPKEQTTTVIEQKYDDSKMKSSMDDVYMKMAKMQDDKCDMMDKHDADMKSIDDRLETLESQPISPATVTERVVIHQNAWPLYASCALFIINIIVLLTR